MLAKLLDPRLVYTGVVAKSKDAVIRLLLDACFAHYSFRMGQEDVFKAINEREAQKGTVFATGIAVPHARIPLFDELIVSLATLKEPIYENGHVIRCVVLILTSETVATLYLNVLATFLKLSQDRERFEEMLGAESPARLIKGLLDAGIKIKGMNSTGVQATRTIILLGIDLSLEHIVEEANDYKVNSPLRSQKPIVWAENNSMMEDLTIYLFGLRARLSMLDLRQVEDKDGVVRLFVEEAKRYAEIHGFKPACPVLAEKRIRLCAELVGKLGDSIFS